MTKTKPGCLVIFLISPAISNQDMPEPGACFYEGVTWLYSLERLKLEQAVKEVE